MEQTLLSPVIRKLIEEANALRGVEREVNSLRDELEIIEPFLRDAEAKSERGQVSDATRVWLKQIKEQADRIEDVVSEYTYRVEHRRSLNKASRLITTWKPRHRIASEIRDIEKSLRKIKERGQSYGLRPFEQGSSSSSNTATNVEVQIDPRLSFLVVDENELVGIDLVSNELIQSLTENELSRMVISLVGEGGIGKTTLAKRVYNDVAVKAHFDCHVWITVSQPFNVRKILKLMKSKICPTETEIIRGQNEEIEDMIDLLRNSLQTQRYVIVFDDVWQTEFWDYIKLALPSHDNGSRILITTRNSKVAYSFKETPFDIIQEIKPWHPKQAWELFCNKAFLSKSRESCPLELKELCNEIVSKCQGLPLVIVALAGLLSKKEKTKQEWERVLNALDHKLEANHKLASVSKILLLSYLDLPYYLKPCFLYFGVFPEDYPVWEDRLYELWIAEGFIAPEGDASLEQVAEKYLNELACRNLVLFETRNLGYQRWFRVHDLYHDIILSKADEFRFSQVVNGNQPGCIEKVRRLSIHGTTKEALNVIGNNRVRSIFLFDVIELDKSFAARLFKALKLLTVLDFEDAPLDNLPKEIGNLVHLKSLNLRRTRLRELPKAIGKLINLQRLDVYDTYVEELPIEINKLTRLRSLQAHCRKDYDNGSYYYVAARTHEGIGNLVELQKLDSVRAYLGGLGFAKELERLTKLKVLSILDLNTDNGKELAASIEKMVHLEKLCLSFPTKSQCLDFKEISLPCTLRYLKLSCRLRNLSCLVALRSLQGLHLSYLSLVRESLDCIAGLPNLAYLYLHRAYAGEELHFREGSFQNLRKLYLWKMEELKSVKIDERALPCLEELQLGPLPLMKKCPEIQHLKNLKFLGLMEMTREFILSLQPNGGCDYWKVKDIPDIAVYYIRKGRDYEFYKLGSSELLKRLRKQANS